MIRCRHEIKYLVSEAQAAALSAYISPFMVPDRHSHDGEYTLGSLYLDSPDLRLCRESLEGVKNRFKLRIRCYSDDPEAPCFFEIKRRINQIIAKSRCCVPRGVAASLIAAGDGRIAKGSLAEDRNLGQFLYYRHRLNALPTARVRYLRQAFESRSGDDVRMTFDRQLSVCATSAPRLDLNGCGWQRLPLGAVVFEIKFTCGYPRWVCRMVQQFGLRPQSLSKYARSVMHACALRFCAPLVGRGVVHGADLAFS